MPVPIAAYAIPAIASLVSGWFGNRAQSSANQRAMDASQQSSRDQLAYLRERDAAEERRYNEQQAQMKAAWDAEQARLAPYRAASAAILSRTMGIPVAPYRPSGMGVPGQTRGTLLSQVLPPSRMQPMQTIQAPQLTISDIAAGRY